KKADCGDSGNGVFHSTLPSKAIRRLGKAPHENEENNQDSDIEQIQHDLPHNGRSSTWCPVFDKALASLHSRVGHQRFFVARTTSDLRETIGRNPASRSRAYKTAVWPGSPVSLNSSCNRCSEKFLLIGGSSNGQGKGTTCTSTRHI